VRLLFTLAFLILTTNSIVWGQGICNDQSFGSGGFSLGSKDFCHDENITINNTAAVEEARYYYNYQGESYDEIKAMGSNAANFSFNSLTKSGVYTVIQVGKKDGKETVSCINDVKVRVANQPVFSYSFCPGSPAKVTVTIPSMPTVNNYTDYTINISGHPQIPKVTTLPYTQTFDYNANAGTLTIVGSGGAKTCSSPPTPVTFNFNPISGTNLDYYPNINQLKIVDNSSVQIDFSGEYNQNYNIFRYNSGSPSVNSTAITPSGGISNKTFTDNLGNAESQSYCYFIQAVNPGNCSLIPAFRSADLCTIPLTVVTKDLTQNVLDWVWYKQPSYSASLIPVPTNPVPSIQIVKTVNASSISYLDNGLTPTSYVYIDDSVECKNRYCYRVKISTSGSLNRVSYFGTSYSNEICVDHKEGPLPAPTDVRVSTDENLKNIVYFENPPSGSYSLDKWFLLKSDGTDFLQIDEIKSPAKEIPDNLSPVTRSETYKVKYQDICENESELSKPVSSVFLAQGGDNKLEWNTSSPFSEKSIKQYEIIYINDDTKQEVDRKPEPSGSSSHTINTAPFTSSGTFKVRIIADDGTESFSNPISVPIKGALFLPTAFTPNSDGLNDTFNLEGSVSSIKEFLMEIFTQAGYKIAELTDPKTGWDGLQSDGTKAEQGPYFYKMTAVMQNGQIINKNGSFALLK
jgi:gliding motility-associated-like protein